MEQTINPFIKTFNAGTSVVYANQKPRALVFGLTGQDSSYMCELLLEKGYEVHGTMRRSSTPNTSMWTSSLGIKIAFWVLLRTVIRGRMPNLLAQAGHCSGESLIESQSAHR